MEEGHGRAQELQQRLKRPLQVPHKDLAGWARMPSTPEPHLPREGLSWVVLASFRLKLSAVTLPVARSSSASKMTNLAVTMAPAEVFSQTLLNLSPPPFDESKCWQHI